MNKCTVIYPNGFFENSTIKELVDSNCEIEMTFLPQMNFSVSPEFLIIAFEFVKSIAFSASYDIMKHTLFSVVNQVKQNKSNKTTITIINDGKRSQIKLSFEATEEQKEKLVDAAIQKLLS